MKSKSDQVPERQEAADPNWEARESEQDSTGSTGEPPLSGKTAPSGKKPVKPEVPPASETWVEGQPTSDADYKRIPPSPGEGRVGQKAP